MDIKCFLLMPTDTERIFLRRYVNTQSGKDCPNGGYHNAVAYIGEEAAVRSLDREWARNNNMLHRPADYKGDPRWPVACEACGYIFREEDEWQCGTKTVYRRDDTHELMLLEEAPAGAIWEAPWLADAWHGEDGKCYFCRTPGGDWCIDSKSSNCGLPTDREHKCWVRHGIAPNFTVDKNGRTCVAGGGSIAIGSFHGFLRGGYLTNA